MNDLDITAREHNEAMDKKRFDAYQSNMAYRQIKPINERHELCPEHAVKVSGGVYRCGDMLFIGDRS